MANDNNIPKGPSNSNTFAPTPGTQQTAAQNVGFTGANINPNMPRGPQLARQGRSSYQRSITPQAPRTPMGMGGQRPRRTGMGRKPVVSRGMPMDAGRGYNMFSGMDANQIGQMNSSMGLSNMTALPSLVGAVDPRLNKDSFANRGPEGWGGRNAEVMHENLVLGGTSSDHEAEHEAQYAAVESAANTPYESQYGDIDADIAAAPLDADPILPDELAAQYEANKNQDIGYDPEKMAALEAQLDDKYARQLQAVMAGVDRQAAMMGAWGGGGHSTMINNAIATSLGQMADEYAQLGLADMQQSELDEAAQMEKAIKLAEMVDSYGDTKGDVAAEMAQTAEMSGEIFSDSTSALMGGMSSDATSFFRKELIAMEKEFQKHAAAATSGAALQIIVDRFTQWSSDFNSIVEGYKGKEEGVGLNKRWAQWFANVFPGQGKEVSVIAY